MSLFSNQNFIHQIGKECGIPPLDEEASVMLQILVEIQTRRVIQEAGKFMKIDGRDEIDFEDIENAIGDLNHGDIVLTSQDESFIRDGSSYIRKDQTYTSAKNFIEQQLKSLTLNSFTQPKLRARWIYLDGKIPRINENNTLKAKSQIITIREKEIGEKHKKFNIIMDQPESMLTGHELDYFKETTEMLSQDERDIGKLQKIDLEGNLSNLFPLFLKFFLGTNLSELKMVYFLQLLKNKYIQKSAEFHLHQILTYLWAYEGQHCLSVGLRIGRYIKSLGNKYPMLYDIWIEPMDKIVFNNVETRHTAYCNATKKIGIELECGLRVDISKELLEWMQSDYVKKDRYAEIFYGVVSQYSGRVNSLRSYVLAYWVPCYENLGDQYMTMSL